MRKNLAKIRTWYLVVLILIAAVYLFNKYYISGQLPAAAPIANRQGKAFAGSASCVTCHKDIYKGYIHTVHYLDSRAASRQSIKGSFDSGKNVFAYSKGKEVVMQRRGDRFFQTATDSGKIPESRPFDIVIGSGRKGQTYLYWNDGELFQLPISYYTALDTWCNSPGYPNKAIYTRPVTAYCLECHTTFAAAGERRNGIGEVLDSSRILYGIDCERCHGPGAEHVAFHQQNPKETTGRYIRNTASMSRQQKLDACALCHSGSRFPLQPAFSFTVGDTLSRFSFPYYRNDEKKGLDVHANQVGLLSASKCFQSSQMDCSSCHNVHNNEAGSIALYSQRCMNCHNEKTQDTCRVVHPPGLVLADNCIDCHMPALPSQKIQLDLSRADKPVHDLLRTHRIAIYPAVPPAGVSHRP